MQSFCKHCFKNIPNIIIPKLSLTNCYISTPLNYRGYELFKKVNFNERFARFPRPFVDRLTKYTIIVWMGNLIYRTAFTSLLEVIKARRKTIEVMRSQHSYSLNL